MTEKHSPETQSDAGFFEEALRRFGPRVTEIEITIQYEGRFITKVVRLSPEESGSIPND